MTMLADKFRVAISDEFLDAFAKIPREQQKKVMKFVKQFKANPTASSINYEKIAEFKDQNLRTVRLDQGYRAIILKPEKGNIYVLLWVDSHDEAMTWASHKKVVIHPETGSLQILTTQEEIAAAQSQEDAPKLFAAVRDRELVRLGIPEELLPQIRTISSRQELDVLSKQLPQEAYEALFFLSEGDSIEEVERALSYQKPESKAPVDTQDFDTALQNPASKQRFFVIEGDADDLLIDAILNAPLEKWRVFLHPAQRGLVERSWSGPVRVLGGAGTGKTVVAMHRAAYLVQKVFNKTNDRVLFTTFTQNLATDIQNHLSKLITPENMKRIEVVHFDKWVADFLNRQGYKFRIGYYQATGGELKELWDEALEKRPKELNYPDSFYREEWDFVVQPQGCTSLQEYLKAQRPSRGTRMSRQQKKEVWVVFEEYRNLLSSKGLRESIDGMRDASQILDKKSDLPPYRAVLVDEAQDMSTEAFRLLRKAVPETSNDMFIVGDGHQRIYRHKVVLSQAGVRIIGRSHQLKINYRTTDEIRSFAVRLLEGSEIDDLDEGSDSSKGYKSLLHGEPPQIKSAATFHEEVEAIIRFFQSDDTPLDRMCLVARTQTLLDQYEAALKAKGIPVYRIRRSQPDAGKEPGLRMATMHRVKGLEFERVAIAGINEGIMPLTTAIQNTEDQAVRSEGEQMERALLYVTITRAKRAALISSYGKPSPWIAL